MKIPDSWPDDNKTYTVVVRFKDGNTKNIIVKGAIKARLERTVWGSKSNVMTCGVTPALPPLKKK